MNAIIIFQALPANPTYALLQGVIMLNEVRPIPNTDRGKLSYQSLACLDSKGATSCPVLTNALSRSPRKMSNYSGNTPIATIRLMLPPHFLHFTTMLQASRHPRDNNASRCFPHSDPAIYAGSVWSEKTLPFAGGPHPEDYLSIHGVAYATRIWVHQNQF